MSDRSPARPAATGPAAGPFRSETTSPVATGSPMATAGPQQAPVLREGHHLALVFEMIRLGQDDLGLVAPGNRVVVASARTARCVPSTTSSALTRSRPGTARSCRSGRRLGSCCRARASRACHARRRPRARYVPGGVPRKSLSTIRHGPSKNSIGPPRRTLPSITPLSARISRISRTRRPSRRVLDRRNLQVEMREHDVEFRLVVARVEIVGHADHGRAPRTRRCSSGSGPRNGRRSRSSVVLPQ